MDGPVWRHDWQPVGDHSEVEPGADLLPAPATGILGQRPELDTERSLTCLLPQLPFSKHAGCYHVIMLSCYRIIMLI